MYFTMPVHDVFLMAELRDEITLLDDHRLSMDCGEDGRVECHIVQSFRFAPTSEFYYCAEKWSDGSVCDTMFYGASAPMPGYRACYKAFPHGPEV